MYKNVTITSEQVGAGHPDKIADQISDAVVDAIMQYNPNGRAAIETMVKDNKIIIAGEYRGNKNLHLKLDYIVKTVLEEIGDKELANNFEVIDLLGEQSADIAQGVDTGGAGDQGIMFGFATRETEQGLPLAYMLATKAMMLYDFLLKNDKGYKGFKPDAKSQVSVKYDEDGKPEIDTFLISAHHEEDMPREVIEIKLEQIMFSVANEFGLTTQFKRLVNPTGSFTIGGSYGDAGLTGRKIIADTYGGFAPHGGGAFSGKDATKVDRSAAYMARHIAKYILKEYTSVNTVTVQLSYAIGVEKPISLNVTSPELSNITTSQIEARVRNKFDLTPRGIVKYLELEKISYRKTAVFGHFTNQGLPWEKV